MPIIDPSLFFALFKYKQPFMIYDNPFFLKYLKLASENIYQNSETIQSLRQFKLDLKDMVLTFNGYFKCQLTIEKDLNNPTIRNFYKYLYDQIKSKSEYKESKREEGKYYFYEKSKIKLFFPNVAFHYEHFWALSDTPIAILFLNLSNSDYFWEEVIKYINLEIDLMSCCGYTIVLCLNFDICYSNYCDSIFKMIINHRFSEIHFSLRIEKDNSKEDIDKIFLAIHESIDKIHGYFYFYSLFVDNISSLAKDLMKNLKKIPDLKIYLFQMIQ